MTKTLEELAETVLRERSAQAMHDFRSSVRPIYASVSPGPSPILKHAGSCSLLSVDDQPILSTAAHVLDWLRKGVPMFVGGPVGTHPVPIVGGVLKTTTPPQGVRELDHLDCGFWEMPDDAVRSLGEVRFVDASRISHNRAPVEHRYYMAMGYALSRNKGTIDRMARTIGNRLSRFSGSVVDLPALAAELGISGAEHMFLRFEKYAQTEDGSRMKAFDPKGFSGGPLLDLGDSTSPAAYTADAAHGAKLAGMLIENKKKHGALVAVKIGPIVRGITRALARG
jgi:hypothetical protein